MAQRLWEVDALRGLAVAAMLIFHAFFDLRYFAHIDLLPAIGWAVVPRAIGCIFLFVAGLSLSLGQRSASERGARLFGLGLGITALTWLLFPTETIWFGILHCIGLCIVIASLLPTALLLPAAAFSAVTGLLLDASSMPFPWLLWLGLRPTQFATLDYWPLLPWLGALLIGAYVGRTLYAGGRKFALPGSEVPVLGFLGRHALAIYLIHQPVLVGLLFVALAVSQ